jgi:hypothetical protein
VFVLLYSLGESAAPARYPANAGIQSLPSSALLIAVIPAKAGIQ